MSKNDHHNFFNFSDTPGHTTCTWSVWLLGSDLGRKETWAKKSKKYSYNLSEVKGPVIDQLKRSHFLEELTGKVHLTQYDAVSSIKPDLARQALEAKRL